MKPLPDPEQQKWENYYANLAVEDVLRDGGEVYAEVAQAMATLVPPGGSVLEAACGSGRHSVELARHVACNLNLLDFSPNAIECARRVFAFSGVKAQFAVGDAFVPGDGRTFDLVFNSGVLEHYDQQRQIDFLAAMSARSRRYVLVMVPNRLCHWYWVWRMQHAAAGRWAFGLEKAASTYRHQIEQAGLHYLGQAYFGAAAIPYFLREIEGLSAELNELIVALHHNEIFPPAQRSYLVAFLASRDADEVPPAGFTEAATTHETADWSDRCVALAADAIANQIAMRVDLERLQKENAMLRNDLARLACSD
jgi:2-polyprenyl-3-methyl-5-hydroxy-6-metoxy-1,4-benzoquinol methylase